MNNEIMQNDKFTAEENLSHDDTKGRFETFLEAEIQDAFHDKHGNAYLTVDIEGVPTTFAVDSQESEAFLQLKHYRLTGKGMHKTKLETILPTLTARARYDGDEKPVWLRVGHAEDDAIEIDLNDGTGRCVRVDKNGWSITQPTVKFLRPSGIAALPEPASGGSLERLWEIVNVQGDDSQALVLAWLVCSIRPKGPHGILVLTGEGASGKTKAMEILRTLIDPAVAISKNSHKTEQDVFIAAQRNWVMSYDNLSFLKGEMSDVLCRLSTGGAHATRKLYTNSGEVVHEACRPIIFNGIDDIVSRQDLLTRAVPIHLPLLTGRRLGVQELDQKLHKHHPGILGCLLDGVSSALRNVDAIDAKDLPRLADFAAFGIAAETGLGLKPGSVLTALNGVQEQAALNALSLDCVGQAVLELMSDHGGDEWCGSASQLMAVSKPELERPGSWPRDAAVFSKQIGRLSGAFRYRGIIVDREHTRDGNVIKLIKADGFEPKKAQREFDQERCLGDMLEGMFSEE